jgi:hypothetical protein
MAARQALALGAALRPAYRRRTPSYPAHMALPGIKYNLVNNKILGMVNGASQRLDVGASS